MFEAVCKATSSIRSSKIFKTVLRAALAAGNYLNHGTRNGNVIGFRCEHCLSSVVLMSRQSCGAVAALTGKLYDESVASGS